MKIRSYGLALIALTVMVSFAVTLISYCKGIAGLNRLLTEDTIDTLRAQEVSLKSLEEFHAWESDGGSSCYDYLLAALATGEEDRDTLDWYIRRLSDYKKTEFETQSGYLKSVWEDLKYFPVPSSTANEEAKVAFSDSWMFARTYGGARGHEGCDIMANLNERGRYPVISMTDGVVEKIGWLTKGGYRIGIRAPHGGYFYYAHLYDYARAFVPGDTVKAGEWLGFMGDSGYSEVEGTVGNFDVHLHVGIYVDQPSGEEMSVNPFWPLRYLEDRKLAYPYY